MTPPAPVHIVSLVASNVKRLRAVEITPAAGAGMITIGGPNAAGKSSILDAIEMALAGRGSMPPQPINEESISLAAAQNAAADADPSKPHLADPVLRIVATLSNGLIITRRRTLAGTDTLQVGTKDGAVYKSPQAMLDALYGALTFDFLAFVRLSPKDQRAQLMQLSGIDFTQLHADRAALVELKRQRTQQATFISTALARDRAAAGDAPAERVDTASIQAAITALRAAGEQRQRAESLREQQRVKAINAAAHRDSRAVQVQRAEAALAQARADLVAAEEAVTMANNDLEAAQVEAENMPKPSDADHRDLVNQLQAAERTNARYDVHAKLAGDNERLLAITTEIASISEATAAIDAAKATALEQAKYPVQGLGISDDGVLWAGRPLEQASQAEQLRVSVAIGLAANPVLRVMLIRDGALLDEKSLALLGALAAEHRAQLWVERVGDDGTCAIVMEDGAVAIDRTHPAGSPQ